MSIYSTLPGNKYATYSGTSMATPFVSGVAALAWAVDPNATVAEVRNAILQGADPVAALSGKVAYGGRLDAYKTLQLLGGHAAAGADDRLAVGLSEPRHCRRGRHAGRPRSQRCERRVTSVYFFRDANNNGQYDASDPIVGSATTIVGGEASIRLNTAGLAPGTYGYFARALDANSHWSTAAIAKLTVQIANSAPQLAPIANQVMPLSQSTLLVNLSASDADGDPLRYSVQVLAADPLVAKAYNLDQQFGLNQWNGNYYTNLRGLNEKYLLGSGNVLYYMLPSGALYRWGGSVAK